MRKSLILAASIATLAISSAAFAAVLDTEGVVKTIDKKHHTLTLASGKTFKLPAAFSYQHVKAGEKVKVVYEIKKHKMIASSVTPI